MKSASNIAIMGATIVVVACVSLVLCLVFILLAELYCSLFFRRRFRKTPFAIDKPITNGTPQHNSISDTANDAHASSSLCSFYSQGVLHAPRSFLFPSISEDIEKQSSHELRRGDDQVVHSLPSSPTSELQPDHQQHFMYISNPIYDSMRISKVNTPFETPESSPSRLDQTIREEEDEDEDIETPPLTPMKKLPAEACSVSLRDARSLCTTGSDSNSNNDCISTSSLGSPSTSPSW